MSRNLDEHGRLICLCGCYDFDVRDSQPWKNGIKVRYRVCSACGLVVTTRESIVDDDASMPKRVRFSDWQRKRQS